MKFIDRKREMSTLEKEYNRENSFVVLYGRRRTGKTRGCCKLMIFNH